MCVSYRSLARRLEGLAGWLMLTLVLSSLSDVGHDSGGQLTEYIRRRPFSLILIDEVEKACREFVQIFLQVLDDGRLTDGKGRVVDFKNTIILFTSNLGAAFLNDAGEGAVKPETRSLVTGAVAAHFPPEFM